MAFDCFYPFTNLDSFQTAEVLLLGERLVFLSQYPEIYDITGVLKLDCEGCIHPRFIVDLP